MPGEAWIGLNDINVENQFVYTDGTPAVSDNTEMTICSLTMNNATSLSMVYLSGSSGPLALGAWPTRQLAE